MPNGNNSGACSAIWTASVPNMLCGTRVGMPNDILCRAQPCLLGKRNMHVHVYSFPSHTVTPDRSDAASVASAATASATGAVGAVVGMAMPMVAWRANRCCAFSARNCCNLDI